MNFSPKFSSTINFLRHVYLVRYIFILSNRLRELGKLVFEKDGNTPICNEILYGRAGYLYSLLLVKKYVPDIEEDGIIKQVKS